MANNNKLTLKEVCQELGKSKRTITRYIKKGILNPEKIKNEKGVIENRFDPKEIEKFKLPEKEKATRTAPEGVGHIGQVGHDKDVLDVLSLLKEQLKTKEKEITRLHKKIDRLIDRQHETNVLIGSLQNKVLKLEHKTKDDDIGQKQGGTGAKIRQFIDRLFGKN